MSTAIPRLTYFSLRGRAEIIRLVLAETGMPFEERSVGPYNPSNLPPEFAELKTVGALPFDALPLWEEPGGLSLAQSDAIVRHVARAGKLYGASEREAALCDMAFEGVKDVRMEVMKPMSADPAKRADLRADLVASVLPRWLGYFDRMLAKGGGEGFLAGGGITFADIALWHLLEALTDNDLAAPLEKLPRLVAFKERIQTRPGIAGYLASPKRFPAQRLPG